MTIRFDDLAAEFKKAPFGWPDGLAWPPPIPPLGPGKPLGALRDLETKIKGIEPARKAEQPHPATQAGILLWFGYLDPSHEISQSIHDQNGSYWHGLMHRREPDHGNSAYWIRRVGNHPVYRLLGDYLSRGIWQSEVVRNQAKKKGPWDPFWMNDQCERARQNGEAELTGDLLALQWAEYHLLLSHCQN